jgi:hypothetical protein
LQYTAVELGRLLTQLQKGAKTPSPTAPAFVPGPPVDPAQISHSAEQLAKLLSEFDPSATDYIDSNHELLEHLFAPDAWARFERLVRNYSFADAQLELERTLRTHPTT